MSSTKYFSSSFVIDFFSSEKSHHYDNDITVWSPQGRLHQVEYALEAVKQGSACVGARSNRHAVICAVLRQSSELAQVQRKVFDIDDNMGVAISGLTADARVLCQWLRTETRNYQFVYGGQQPVGRLVKKLSDKAQVNTQQYGSRPYGVGLLLVGTDAKGVHLYETDPSGNFFEYNAQAIGSRSQSARTYLEKNFESFPDVSKDALIKHALRALRETLTEKKKEDKEKRSSEKKDMEPHTLEIIEGEALNSYLSNLDDIVEGAAEDKMEVE